MRSRGLCAGLAASTKYNAAMVVLAIATAHWLVYRRDSLRTSGRVVWAALWSLAGFAVATPYAVLDFDHFSAGLLKQFHDYAPEAGGDLSQTWPISEYLRFFWTTGLMPIPACFAALGTVWALARRHRPTVVVLTFAVPYVLLFLPQRAHYFRNMLPLLPPLLLIAAYSFEHTLRGVFDVLAGWLPPQRQALANQDGRSVVGVASVLFLLAWPLHDAVALTRFEALPHSKVRAAQFLNGLPQGAPIAAALNPVQEANKPFVTPVNDAADRSAAWYRSQGYRYLLANTRDTDVYRYAALRAESRLLAAFPGDKEGQPGPRMEAIDLETRSEQLAITRRTARFDDQLALLGYQRGVGALRSAFTPLSNAAVAYRGHGLLLNLYWQPLQRMDEDYTLFVHLRDAQGRTVAQRDAPLRAYDYPTSHWAPGEFVVDLADLPLPDALAPGVYQLVVGVYLPQTMQRLPVTDDSNEVELMTVVVR